MATGVQGVGVAGEQLGWTVAETCMARMEGWRRGDSWHESRVCRVRVGMEEG